MLDEDLHWMSLALEEASKAEALGEVPVGAVVVQHGELIASAGNRSVHQSDPSAHAELIAVRDAAAAMGNYRLPGCSVYVTLEPCLMCVGAMVHARVNAVIFAASDPKSGALGGVFDAQALPGLNHRFQVRQGIMRDDASEQLKRFFRARRKTT